MYGCVMIFATRTRLISDNLTVVGTSIVEYCSLSVTVKFFQSATNLQFGNSANDMLVIELGGFMSSKDGHNGTDSNGIMAHILPVVSSSIMVVSLLLRLYSLMAKRIIIPAIIKVIAKIT